MEHIGQYGALPGQGVCDTPPPKRVMQRSIIRKTLRNWHPQRPFPDPTLLGKGVSSEDHALPQDTKGRVFDSGRGLQPPHKMD